MLWIALLLHSWWIIPVIILIYLTFKEQIEVARKHGDPVLSVFTNAANGLLALIIKGGSIFVLIIVAVIVLSFGSDLFSGSSYGPEYEGYRR